MRPLLLVILFGLTLSACGIKGPLEHPPARPAATGQVATPAR